MAPYKVQLLTKSESQQHQWLLSQVLTPFSLCPTASIQQIFAENKLVYRSNKDNHNTRVRIQEKALRFPHSKGVPLQLNRNKLQKQHL